MLRHRRRPAHTLVTNSGLTAFTVNAGLPGKPYVVYRPLLGLPAMTVRPRYSFDHVSTRFRPADPPDRRRSPDAAGRADEVRRLRHHRRLHGEGGWRAPTLAAFMVSAAETVGGIALILGLLTPLAAMAVVAAMIDAWAVNVSGAAFWSDPVQRAVRAGVRRGGPACSPVPGVYSLDERLWGRATWPRLVAVIAAGVWQLWQRLPPGSC